MALTKGTNLYNYIGMAAASALGSFGFFSVPFIVGAVADGFASPSLGGIAASVEFAAVGVSSLWVATLSPRVRPVALIFIGAVMLILGHGATSAGLAVKSLPLVLAARVAVGLAEGMLYALANSFASHTANPVRTFSAFAIAQVIYSMATFLLLTRSGLGAPAAMPLIFGATALATSLLLLLAPRSRTDTAAMKGSGNWGDIPLDAKLALAGLAAFWTAAYLMIPFVERIGLGHGFTREEIAIVVSLHSLPSFVGPGIAAVLGARLGAVKPVLVVILFEITALTAIMFSTEISTWSAGILGFTFFMYVFFPIFNGMVAKVDPTGRANILSVTIAAAAAVAGPLVSSALVSGAGGYGRIWPAAVAIYGIMALLLLKPLRRADALTATGEA